MIEVLVVDDDTRVARVNAAYVDKEVFSAT